MSVLVATPRAFVTQQHPEQSGQQLQMGTGDGLQSNSTQAQLVNSKTIHQAYGPVPDQARQGRMKQRYSSNGERLVAGCIPIRLRDGRDCADSVEVLLISSRAGKGFCFPKGGWEDDETVELAAQRETVEEAGVRGELEEPMIGLFPFQSGKPGSTSIHQGRCIAHMYILHVAEMLDVWPEAERQRIWVPLVEAVQRCRHAWMREALLTWVRRKGWTLPPTELPVDGLQTFTSVTPQLSMNADVQALLPPAEPLQGFHGLLDNSLVNNSLVNHASSSMAAGEAAQQPLSSVQVGTVQNCDERDGMYLPSTTSDENLPSRSAFARSSVQYASGNSLSADASEAPSSPAVNSARPH